MSNYADDLALALELAELADAITLDRFEATDLDVSSKPDMTPVSDADLAVETALREKLATARPSDAILGEEFGGETELTGRQWVIDPIDGTKNFVRGVPVWATTSPCLTTAAPSPVSSPPRPSSVAGGPQKGPVPGEPSTAAPPANCVCPP